VFRLIIFGSLGLLLLQKKILNGSAIVDKKELLRRAWDALDAFKQAYPENWHEEDQQVMDDLLKADLDLSGVERKWQGLTDEEIMEMLDYGQYGNVPQYARNFVDAIEAKLKEKNT
jgi:hypothetical protein